MVEITLNIKGKRGKAKTILIPQSWEEVAPQDVVSLLGLSSNKTRKSKEMAVLYFFGENAYLLSRGQVSDLIPHIEFLYEKEKEIIEFVHGKQHSFDDYFNVIEHEDEQLWVMPSKLLYNTKMGEIKIGLAYLAAYVKTEKEAHLNKMIAVFCRPPDPYFDPMNIDENADRREPFSPILSDQRASLLSDLPVELKSYCLQFIVSSLEKIKKKKQYESLFKPTHSTDNKIDIWIWRDFTRAMAKVGNLGKTIKEIDEEYFHDVLHEAAKCEIEYEEEKERLEMQKALMNAR